MNTHENDTQAELAAWEILAETRTKLDAARAEIKTLTQAHDVVVLAFRKVDGQRDRIADALTTMWPFIEEDDYPNCNTPVFDAAIKKYKDALQSLTDAEPNKPSPSVGATE